MLHRPEFTKTNVSNGSLSPPFPAEHESHETWEKFADTLRRLNNSWEFMVYFWAFMFIPMPCVTIFTATQTEIGQALSCFSRNVAYRYRCRDNN